MQAEKTTAAALALNMAASGGPGLLQLQSPAVMGVLQAAASPSLALAAREHAGTPPPRTGAFNLLVSSPLLPGKKKCKVAAADVSVLLG